MGYLLLIFAIVCMSYIRAFSKRREIKAARRERHSLDCASEGRCQCKENVPRTHLWICGVSCCSADTAKAGKSRSVAQLARHCASGAETLCRTLSFRTVLQDAACEAPADLPRPKKPALLSRAKIVITQGWQGRTKIIITQG